MKKFTLLRRVPAIRYFNERIELSESIVTKIEDHWNGLIESGKSFTRGDVFTVKNVENIDNNVEIDIVLSDYAHYLATIHGVLEEKYFCRVVHSSIMIETSDNFLVFGEMNNNTALPGRIQCVGGGITREDLSGNGILIDMERNASNELVEEVGLSVNNHNQIEKFFPWAIVESGPQKSLGIVYWAKLSINLEQFIEYYKEFEKELNKKGEQPELSKILFIEKDSMNKKEWLNKTGNPYAEYLPIIFENL